MYTRLAAAYNRADDLDGGGGGGDDDCDATKRSSHTSVVSSPFVRFPVEDDADRSRAQSYTPETSIASLWYVFQRDGRETHFPRARRVSVVNRFMIGHLFFARNNGDRRPPDGTRT